MPGNPLVRFDEGRGGRINKCRPLSYSTVIFVFSPLTISCESSPMALFVMAVFFFVSRQVAETQRTRRLLRADP